jgi:hypothetical protein
VACPSKKSKIEICVEGLNGKALEEAGKWNTVASLVRHGSAAHGSGASMMEMTKAIEQIYP